MHLILNKAKDESILSTMSCHYGSVISKGKKPIVSGHNHYRSCFREHGSREYCTMFHAERDCLIKFLKRCFRGKKITYRKMKKYKIFITRTKNYEDELIFMNCAPCQECIIMLQKVGFKKAITTDINNKLQTYNINKLNPHEHFLSYAQKHFKEYKQFI
uniref:CMP/dCMP-type deaminase domain-containing protein n=1 Tax=viral metagenome TaxID=1070528 RepID=A0A6C0KGU7_9ZZZZ